MVGQLLDFLHVFVVTDPVPAGTFPGKCDSLIADGVARVQNGAHGVVTIRSDAADGIQYIAFVHEVSHYGGVVQYAAKILDPAAAGHEDSVVVDEADDANAHVVTSSVCYGRPGFPGQPELDGHVFDHLLHGDAAHAVVGSDGTPVPTMGTARPAVQGGLDDPVPRSVRDKPKGGYRGPE